MLDYTPRQTGLAFLPQIVVLAVVAQPSSNLLLPRLGPKLLVPAGIGMCCSHNSTSTAPT